MAAKFVYSSSVEGSDKPAILLPLLQPNPVDYSGLDALLHAHNIALHQFDGTQRHKHLGARITSAVPLALCLHVTAALIGLTMASTETPPRNDPTGTQQAIPSDPKPQETQVPPISASREKPLSAGEEAQVQKIVNATEARDWHALRNLAASPGGFIDDEVRRIVCT